MRDYMIGTYHPLVGYLMKEGSVPLEELKKRYMSGVGNELKDIREKKFVEWLNSLNADHIISIEYDTVTFNTEQWEMLKNKI